MHFDRLRHARRIALVVMPVLAAALGLAGCGTSTKPIVVGPPLSRVAITPAGDSLVAGTSAQFVAVAYDTGGAAVDVGIAWSSTLPAVCTVNSNGLAQAQSEGVALIVASASDKADTAMVYVTGVAMGWNAQVSGTAANLNAVFFQPDGRTGFAVGAGGAMVVTTDAGSRWMPRASGTPADLRSVWFSSALTGWTAGDGGVLMKSVNGGSTWTQQTNLGTTFDLNCVRFIDDAHGWIVGANGLVARTRDGGASWSKQNLFSYALHSVSFTDTLNGWAVGASGKVVGTRDGGDSWYEVSLPISSQTLRAVSRVDGQVACAVGTQGTVARTYRFADSLAWTHASLGAANQLNGVWMADSLAGWAVGSNASGLVMATVNGGASWTTQAANSAQALNAVLFVDRQRGWAVGAAGRIIHTSHAGNP